MLGPFILRALFISLLYVIFGDSNLLFIIVQDKENRDKTDCCWEPSKLIACTFLMSLFVMLTYPPPVGSQTAPFHYPAESISRFVVLVVHWARLFRELPLCKTLLRLTFVPSEIK